MPIYIRPIQRNENEDVYAMFQEIPAMENGATNKFNGLSFIEFQAFCCSVVDRAEGKNLPKDRYPQAVFIIFDNEKPVGFGKYRPFLNEQAIQNRAGHFAYMIRPSCRGKGYATEILKRFKQLAVNDGLTALEGSIEKDNHASRRVIEKNGGQVKEYFKENIVFRIALTKEK